jgi:hypothetical protein
MDQWCWTDAQCCGHAHNLYRQVQTHQLCGQQLENKAPMIVSNHVQLVKYHQPQMIDSPFLYCCIN